MPDADERIDTYAKLAALLDYPHDPISWRIAEARQNVAEACPEALPVLDALRHETGAVEPEHLEEVYVKTFDFAPLCTPYVGVQLFGPEGFKRPQLMADLSQMYTRNGRVPSNGELPDHLGVILRNRPCFDELEWEEMVRLCLLPATARMLDELERNESPYRHVLRALRMAFHAEFPEETKDA